MNRDLLVEDLERDEGRRLMPYQDTVGKTTIGIGRNIDDRGITDYEADVMLHTDINVAEEDLDQNIPWWSDMPEPAQRGLCNMSFNLGWPRLSGFKNMLAALQRGDYQTAADEALDSQWANQVGERASRIADLYRSCA